MTEHLPVIIAGAGPTGLMARSCSAQGIPVIVFEAEPGLTHDLRAGSFHPPTLEMMAPYGVTARMHETGIQVRRWQIRDQPGDLVAEFDLGLLADITPYPYRLHLEQHRVTPIQLDLLRAEHGADVRFGHRVTGFTQDADRVPVHVESGDGPLTLDGSWLIAADGGRTSMREEPASNSRASPGRRSSSSSARPTTSARTAMPAMNCYIADPVELAPVQGAGRRTARALADRVPADPDATAETLLEPARVEAPCRRSRQARALRDPLQKHLPRASARRRRISASAACCSPGMPRISTIRSAPSGSTAVSTTPSISPTSSSRCAGARAGRDCSTAICGSAAPSASRRCSASRSATSASWKSATRPCSARGLRELIAVAGDPARARQHLLDTSMITGVRRGEQVQ